METSVNNKYKAFTSLEQSKKLAEILPLESADMFYDGYKDVLNNEEINYQIDVVSNWTTAYPNKSLFEKSDDVTIPCWSLAALYAILPEINGVSPKIEKVKAEDGYDGYYYPIEYEGIVLIPYPKNPVDACYEMIIKLKGLNIL